MAKCMTCGNEYDKAFEINMMGKAYIFDSFECAIQKLAPVCDQCGCRIIGHGVEAHGSLYCSASCAGRDGNSGLQDRV